MYYITTLTGVNKTKLNTLVVARENEPKEFFFFITLSQLFILFLLLLFPFQNSISICVFYPTTDACMSREHIFHLIRCHFRQIIYLKAHLRQSFLGSKVVLFLYTSASCVFNLFSPLSIARMADWRPPITRRSK